MPDDKAHDPLISISWQSLPASQMLEIADGRTPTRNVNLSYHFDSFIEGGVQSGRFSSASEAVLEGLRLLEQREHEDSAKIEWLSGAAKEGFNAADRGDFVVLNSEQELGGFFEQIHEEVVAEVAAERKRG